MIRILLFAELQDIVGQRELTLEATDINVQELRRHLLEQYPELTGINNAMAAINEEYAEEQTPVRDGDVVAFIPPVSGG
ncbi:molybdopterin converting factor subunit 1 [Evansella halocellulosilytica]|uniref:molybdopterin converting factor subunit 1 n=1 Tax=Evansella halocellulosilytica TaxID=2011013 RepID=UPI000BB75A20|nr:molybdopterin converting factor subunit 1 [Evansella halocellulosilytica]